MTAISAPTGATVQRGEETSPQKVGEMSKAIASLSGWSPKHSEYAIALSRKVTNWWVRAAHMAGRREEIAIYFAHADAQRHIDGSPLALDAHLLCHIARDAAAEGVKVSEFLAYKSPEERAALLKQTRKLATDAAELVAALEAMPV